MSFRKKLAYALGAAAVGVTGALVAVEPAVAAPPACPYPYVCFYDRPPEYPTNKITGKYQVVTSGFQTISGSSRASAWIVNTRHDDVAYVRFVNGSIVCLEPESSFDTSDYIPITKINGVRISSSSTC